MAQPKHRIPGTRRRFVASVVAVVCLGSGLGVMGVAVASQPPAPVMPAAPAPAGSAEPAARAAVDLASAAADLGGAPPQAGDSWTRVRAAVDGPGPVVAEAVLDTGKPTAIDPAVLPVSEPAGLVIPSIGVNTPVRDLGLDPRGGLEVPQPGPHYDEAAWYRHSPTPGELGPAVLLGHIDSAANGPSVFFRLGELAAGDLIEVTRADGSVAVFAVDEVHRYAKADFPTELVYGDIDHAGLRILTCGGAFDRAARSYVDNIVVFASLV